MIARLSRRLVASAALAILTSCSSGGSDSVNWDNYSPSVRTRIDSASASGDCATLQSEFDNADANDAAQRNRTGEGNAALMGYIDDALSSAGCYG